MFHRASSTPNVNKASSNAQSVNQNETSGGVEKTQYRKRVESSTVEQYAKSQDEITMPKDLANQNTNRDMPQNGHQFEPVQTNQTNNVTTTNNEKEVTPMNNPEAQAKDIAADDKKAPAAQNRDVNIPGNNFQRPGMQPAASRPSYPGSYSAANTSANNPYAAGQSNSDNGRKLVIGQGITMSGEIESCEHLIVEGTIEATLKGASVLDVYESGAFLGTVEIDEANIAGRFEGDITVSGRLTIEATGQVIGSISYKELSMEAGAVIDGSVSPIGSKNAAAKKPAASTKSKKASENNGAELPFSDKAAAE